MPKNFNVLIAGGSGFIGRHLTKLLDSKNVKIKILTRSLVPKPNQISWSQVKASQKLPADTDHVINLSGNNIMNPLKRWNGDFKRSVYESRVETARLLANLIDNSPHGEKPLSFIQVSGVGYYRPHPTKEYTESSGPGSSDCGHYLSKLAVDWEEAAKLQRTDENQVRQVIIRPGAVLGLDGGVLKSMYFPFLMFLGGPIGNGQQWFPWIHVHDMASLFAFSLFNNHVTGVINGVSPHVITNAQFSLALGKAMGRPAKLSIPSIVPRLLFGDDRAAIMLYGQKVKSRAESIGFRFAYPNIDSALANCLRK